MNFGASRWLDEYKRCGALWIHDGNPRRPHALLTSGKHSDGFFNSGLVAEEPSLLVAAVDDLLCAVVEQVDTSSVDYVVGPATGAIVLAHCLAHALDANPYSGRPCRSTFAEKLEDGTMALKRTTLREGSEVLVVEDVITTGGSVERTVEAVARAGGRSISVVAALVNRSGLKEVQGRKVVALVDHPVASWSPEECPLCAQGSEAVRPKGAESWARLRADYQETDHDQTVEGAERSSPGASRARTAARSSGLFDQDEDRPRYHVLTFGTRVKESRQRPEAIITITPREIGASECCQTMPVREEDHAED
jgi:orotate phosphoribosyltransferase